MTHRLEVRTRHRPVLDPDFLPAVLWNRAYRERVRANRDAVDLGVALVRQDGTAFTHKARILPPTAANAGINRKYVERLVKFLLWQKGGCTIQVAGCPPVARMLAAAYAEKGLRAFDRDLVGRRMFGQPIAVEAVKRLPPVRETQQPLGRHLDGCRIGFDLGGSDRKCAAVVDGKVVFSDEVVWDPYFEKDPWYHFEGINDTLRRAAAHLPRVDAIGGSAAGVYVNNEPRVGSLFRGDRRARLRPAHPRHLPRAPVVVGRGALRGRQRRRGDRARRLDVAEGERGARLLAWARASPPAT